MIVLAVDATGDGLTAALDVGGRVLRASRTGRTPHDEALLPAVEGLLRRARLSWKDLDAVAAAAGPGRFTGIRVGLAFAAAAGFRLGVPALALSRLEARAEGAPGDVLAALPGWKGEVYHQRFRRTRRGPVPDGAAAWAPADEWPRVRAEAEARGLAVAFSDVGAAELASVARRRLAARDLPPFEPFYLKPAGYEKNRR
ncbi:MAG: tRNA (adenosine(37)-N6)-threonylcarbamoyltransferase complex dimerization subunit type 1 TsaB [Elusimicrobia bacterium]|nr:tRNA (adenosine(37)-N6)-threonylcarbamoyltransferase complex dimerization subunit type 1 TsaB [Elusimicrobiota bacterium]